MSKIIITSVDPNQTPSPPAGYVTIILGNDGILYTLDSAGTLVAVGTGVVSSNNLFTYTQSIPSTTWLITHNLNTFPSVTLVNSLNKKILADLEYINQNTVLVTFSEAMIGKAYLTYNPI